MQISDSPPSHPPATAGKQEAMSVGGEGTPGGRGRSGQAFRKTLDRRRPATGADSAGNDGASAAAMAGWFRAESALPPAAAKAPSVAGVAGARPVDRVLIGAGPEGAQARIRIGAGALAGTEIQLSSASGRAVEAQLLTHAASSRQTLSVVLDEIRSRLRDRGIVLSTRAVPPQPAVHAGEPGSEDRAAVVRRARPQLGSGR